MVGKTILEEVGATGLGELIPRVKVLVEVKRKKETGGTTEGIRTGQKKEMALAARSLVNIWLVEEQTAYSSSTCSQEDGLERAEP